MSINSLQQLIFKLLIILIVFGLSHCTLVENPDDQLAKDNNYYQTKEVSDILNGTCATSGCHGGTDPVNGFSTEIQTKLILGASDRPLDGVSSQKYGGDNVIPYDVDKSLMIQIITGNIVNKMSYNHAILSESQISTLANWVADGCQNHLEQPAYANPQSYRVYVCNQLTENVSIIDGTEKVVSYLTDVYDPTNEDDTPYDVAEFGAYYYVTLSSAGESFKYRKSDNTVVSSIGGISDAGRIQINRDGTKAYVSRTAFTENLYNSIYVIDLISMRVIKQIAFGLNGLLHGMALDITRGYLYITDSYNNIVLVVNTLNDTIIDIRYTLTQNYSPLFLEVSPDGNYLYITAPNTNQLLIINTGSRQLIWYINMLSAPMGVTVSSTGQKIYVASYEGNAVEVVTKVADNWNKTNTIEHTAFSMCFDIDITADDSYVYVTNQNLDGDFVPAYKVKEEGEISTVGIINTFSETVEKVIEVEEAASGICVEQL